MGVLTDCEEWQGDTVLGYGQLYGRSPWSTTPTCKNGHEWTEENTHHPPKRPTQRHCRECMAIRSRRR